VREADGLALSSRNAYLTPDQRLPQLCCRAAWSLQTIENGPIAGELSNLEQSLLEHGFASVDYAELRRAGDLAPIAPGEGGEARLLVAARIGKARLIDNRAVRVPQGWHG
jgi:pantoate--beta-alanine ligase